MKILEEGIEDRKNNFTRFLVLTRRKSLTHGDSNRSNNTIQQSYKTSIIFSVKHAPGALHKILGEFASRGINLTKVESRPTKEKPWEYNFYLDFEGTQQDSRVDEALDSLRKLTASLKIIGSYPRADFT
jgi:prephenate dehydratase